MRTKKVGIGGKFGSRYGKSVKADYVKIQNLKKVKWKCPECLKPTLKRGCSGIWECKNCGYKMAGKAYKPK